MLLRAVYHGTGTLIVQKLRTPLDFLRGQRRDVDREIPAYIQTAPHGRTIAQLLEPALEVRELLNVLILRLPIHGPGIGNNICNRVIVPRQKSSVVEPIIQHSIEPVRFVIESAQRIGLVSMRGAGALEMSV